MSIQKEVNKFYIITSQVRIENLIDNNSKKVAKIFSILGIAIPLWVLKEQRLFFE